MIHPRCAGECAECEVDVGLAQCLWERWWPDKVCTELLDDMMQAVYNADERGDDAACCPVWLDAWSDVLRPCDATRISGVSEFDDGFPMTQSLFNWCQDFLFALDDGGALDPGMDAA